MNLTAFEKEDIQGVAELPLAWEKLAKKTVLLSGGTGFIGQFLISVIQYRNEKFGDGIKVVSLSRNPPAGGGDVVYLKHDIKEKFELDVKPDFVLHLASNTHPAQYSADAVGTITANVFGCSELLRVATENGARFLLASSVEVYGDGNGTPMDEGYCGKIDCNTARAGYNEAKRVSESLCQAYRQQYGTNAVIVRLARCFGADRKKDTKALAQFLEKAVSGEDIVLKSAGAQRFSYCYVADAASGIFKVLSEGIDGQAYNVSDDDEGKTLGDYARLIAESAGRKVTFDFDPEKNKGVSAANYAVLDCAKLKALGWSPRYTVSDGLRRTLNILQERKK